MIALYIMAENFCNDGSIKRQQIDHTRIYLKQIAKMGEFFTAIKNFIRQTTSLIQHGSYCMSNAYNRLISDFIT